MENLANFGVAKCINSKISLRDKKRNEWIRKATKAVDSIEREGYNVSKVISKAIV